MHKNGGARAGRRGFSVLATLAVLGALAGCGSHTAEVNSCSDRADRDTAVAAQEELLKDFSVGFKNEGQKRGMDGEFHTEIAIYYPDVAKSPVSDTRALQLMSALESYGAASQKVLDCVVGDKSSDEAILSTKHSLALSAGQSVGSAFFTQKFSEAEGKLKAVSLVFVPNTMTPPVALLKTTGFDPIVARGAPAALKALIQVQTDGLGRTFTKAPAENRDVLEKVTLVRALAKRAETSALVVGDLADVNIEVLLLKRAEKYAELEALAVRRIDDGTGKGKLVVDQAFFTSQILQKRHEDPAYKFPTFTAAIELNDLETVLSNLEANSAVAAHPLTAGTAKDIAAERAWARETKRILP